MSQQFQPEWSSRQPAHDPSSQINQSYPYQNPPQMQDFSSYYYNTQFVGGHSQQPQPQGSEGGDGPGMGSGQVPEQQQSASCYPGQGQNIAMVAAAMLLAQTGQIAGALGAFLATQCPVIGGPGLVSGPGLVPPGPETVPRPMHSAGGPFPCRGGGKRGGCSFRGKGQGSKGNHQPRRGGSVHGIGHALVTGRSPNLQQHDASSSHSELSAAAENVKSKEKVAKHSADTLKEGGIRPQALVVLGWSAVTKQQPTDIADLPRTSGNSLSNCLVSQPAHQIHGSKCKREGAQETGESPNLQQHGASFSHSEPSTVAEKVKSKGEIADPSAGTLEEGGIPPQTPVVAARSVQCKQCGVDCTSLKMLEEHVNGKRHMKKLQSPQLLNNAKNPAANERKESITLGDSNPEVASQPKITTGGDENKKRPHVNLLTNVTQSNEKAADLPRTTDNLLSDCPVSQPGHQIRSLKRKRKSDRRKKVNDVSSPSKPLKPEKSKGVSPFICDLCNVKCHAEQVFKGHLSGKKHISNFTRFQANQAILGTPGLHALYPPNSVVQNLSHLQGAQQALHTSHASYPTLGAVVSAPSQNASPSAIGIVSEMVPNPNQLISNGIPQFV